MKCQECGGDINLQKGIPFRTNRSPNEYVCPCKVCFRLHCKDGQVARNVEGKKAILRDDKVSIDPE